MVKFLHGDEPYLITDGIRKELKSLTYPEVNLKKSDVFDSSFEEFLYSHPLLEEKRVAVLELSALSDITEAQVKRLALVPESTTLLITSRKVDERSRVFKLLSGFVVPCNKLSDSQLNTFVLKQVKSLNRNITVSGMELFLKRIGYHEDGVSLFTVKTAIQQICHAGDVTDSTVSSFLEETVESKLFNLSTYIWEGRGMEAFRLLEKLFSDKESGIKILSVLLQKYRLALKVADGATLSEIGVSTYQLGKFGSVKKETALSCFELITDAIRRIKEGEGEEVICRLTIKRLLLTHEREV